MKARVFAILSLFLAAALGADWVRRANIQGNITDIAFPEDHSEIYVATDGAGVWWWFGGQWVERNGGLPDLRVTTLVVRPDNPLILKAGLLSGQVYKTIDGGVNWTEDSLGMNILSDSVIPADLAMVWDDYAGQWYSYMATIGAGVLRQGSSGLWLPFNNGLQTDIGAPIKDVLSVGAASLGGGQKHLALAGTRYSQDAGTPGKLFRLDTNDQLWVPVSGLPSGQDYSIPAIAFHQPELAYAALTVDSGGTGLGVYFNTAGDLSTWAPVCSNPPDQSFISLDYFYDAGPGVSVITAGTTHGLYFVDDPNRCDSGYTPFTRFRGAVRAVGLLDAATGVAGGPGKGPFLYDPSNPLSLVVNRRQGMQDNNVLDIAMGPFFGTPGGDSTVFAASGIAGVYKNVDPITPGPPVKSGYFYRMIGAPDSWSVPPVLKIRPVPNYNEAGCVPNRTVFAATNGQGVMRSLDGGRSWQYANGGSTIMRNGVVTDIVFDPGYASLNMILYASLYGRGVFRSTDNGDSWSILGALSNPRVLCLAIGAGNGQLFAGCRTLSGIAGQRGLFYWTGDSWNPIGPILLDNKSVTVIGLPPSFPTLNWIFLGTENSGALASADGGASFVALNTGLPSNAAIYDLQLEPYFNYPGSNNNLLVAVRPTTTSDGGVYFTNYNRSWQWAQVVSGLPSKRVLSVAFSPTFVNGGQVFCGLATQGLYFGALNTATADLPWLPAAGFYNVPPDITGIAVSPDDQDLVFATTAKDGVFVSRDGGDTFQPWGGGLQYSSGGDTCLVETTLSVGVTHQTPPSQNTFLQEDFSGFQFPPTGWGIWDGGSTGFEYTWMREGFLCDRGLQTLYPALFTAPYAIIDSDCQQSGYTQDDWLVTSPTDTSAAERVLLQFNQYFRMFSGADHGYVKVCSTATGGNCNSPAGDWVTAADFAGQNFLQRSSVDLTPWKGTGMRVAFHYTGAYDWWWAIDDVSIVQLLPRVVVGTKDHGLYYADAGDDVFFGQFTQSNVQNGTVNEVRYDGISEDMRASHVPDGDYSSSDYGATWTKPDPAMTMGLSDVSYGAGLAWGRAITGFTWGCSSGKSLSFTRALGDGAAWYFDPFHDCNPGTIGIQACWQECPTTGLGVNEDYRSILQLASGTLLLGAIDTGSGGTWEGLYRSGASCASWVKSNEGLPPNAKVYAFHQDPALGYVLASVVDSDPAVPDYGGVYYSDASSDGRAWAKTNLPSSAPGSYDLASTSDGTSVYTGLAGDGVFSSVSGAVTVPQPAAYFETASQACVNTAVQFYDYSAGKVTGWSWNFGDSGTSTLQNPSHTYTSAATYYPTLDVTSSLGSDDYALPPPGLLIKDELDVGSALRASKSGPNALLTWTDLNQGETGYQVWASNSPSSGAAVGAPLGPDVVSTTLSGYAYFRIQPLSSTHVCGNGIIGGAW